MTLPALVAFAEPVDVGGTKVEMRGLNLADIGALMARWGTPLAALVDGSAGEQALSKLLETAPDFVAEVIARSAGEPDSASAVIDYPAGVQLQLLEVAWRLTAVDEAALGNWLRRALEGGPALRAALSSPSRNATPSSSTSSSAPAMDSTKSSASRSRGRRPAPASPHAASADAWLATQASFAAPPGPTSAASKSSSAH